MAMNLEKAVGGLKALGAGLATLAKVALRSKWVGGKAPAVASGRPVVVMGNGPSLRHTLDNERSLLLESDLMAVNFFPLAPEWRELRPSHLVLADPHFFAEPLDPKVAELWESVSRADWPLTLHVPADRLATARRLAGEAPALAPMNLTPAEGSRWLRHRLFRRGLAMPRPRNVLVPALMEALRMGCRDIRLAGADHTWTRTLAVDDRNRVVSVQPHFYADTEGEQQRIDAVYAGVRLHEVLFSMATALRSYFDVAAWASELGATVLNISPGSFIDAFPRPAREASAEPQQSVRPVR